ncbi:outer membrane beta-barrel protein [Hymenobacter sp.]|uniref:outer membrane beta-barrel protein n=1 Tax=Hymenobacter sp. TaxID=1898978 RepID=UPI00286A3CB5|nr:outer membrane beta-barrel protein [Hymenobacter sp.]
MRLIVTGALLLSTTIAFGQVSRPGSGGLHLSDSTNAPADAANGRALPSPLSALPFPSGEWVGPVIGAPDKTSLYPLQKALGGQATSRYRVYGWLNPSYTASTSKNSNIPVAYNIKPNALVMSQAVVRAERIMNTVQTDHVDWGFRSSYLYGIDYRYTVAKGLFSDQLLKRNSLNGFDPIEQYLTLYVPKVAEGLTLRVGRYISPPDIEAQLAPDNYLFSHSLTFSYDPFTFTGALAALRLSPQVTVQLGVHAGNEMVPWSESAKLNGQAFIRWVAKNNNNSLYGGINSLGEGSYSRQHDNVQMVVATWGHRFGPNVHMMTESYYLWQRDALAGGTVINGPDRPWAGSGAGALIPGRSHSYAAVNYFQVLLSPTSYLSVRNDLLNHLDGQRTGNKTLYSSHTVGYVKHFGGGLFTFRPEIRYDNAYADGIRAYDKGTRRDQLVGALDLIAHF